MTMVIRNEVMVVFALSLVGCLQCFEMSSCDDGTILLELKKSFRDVKNVLRDWMDSPSSDYCVWRGVQCDNVTSNVKALNLSSLNLGGELSPAIGYLKGLIKLDLSFNNLYGRIPLSILKLRQLEILNIAENKLTGEIPRQIYWNEHLQYIDLQGNNLVGMLSPDMCQPRGLWFLNIKNNNLTGNIPENIGNCTSFRFMDLSYNQLTGEIPVNIRFLQVATLVLEGNRLSGPIPSVIGLMSGLTSLKWCCNMLTGLIPPSLGNLVQAKILELHDNRLSGRIPLELGNMSGLHYLNLDNNNLSGQLPPELGKLGHLLGLNVANNNLEGPIPEDISMCKNLNILNLHGNKFNGTIPRSFPKLRVMTKLNLSSNNLGGFIPVELSRIDNLDTLDISDNKLGGFIPASLGNLEHLLTLNLSGNHLSGFIPDEFGNLRSIMDIDLSNNQLSGIIPEQLSKLDYLFSLKLDHNNLTGDLVALTDCLSLNILNISYNNLTGDLPTSNNFSRFSPDSFIGNPNLCGYWMNATCHTSRPTERGTVSKAVKLGIAIGVGALVIILMTVVVAFRLYHRPTPSQGQSVEMSSVTSISPKVVVFHMNMAHVVYEDIMRATDKLSDAYIIGYGKSSRVYKCVLNNSRPVAIKRYDSQNPQNPEFESELETVGRARHRNLVELQAYCLSPLGILLFYDHMENGSLRDLLHGQMENKLDWEIRLKIALGVSQGLSYLHRYCRPRIIHKDVSTSNILLDKDLEAHLSNFGITKRLIAPESYMSTSDPNDAQSSTMTDVYSYGIVLLELLTGKKAVDNESNFHDLILSKTASIEVMQMIDPEISTTSKDFKAVEKMMKLALWCTGRSSGDRPHMDIVTLALVTISEGTAAAGSVSISNTAADEQRSHSQHL